MPRRPAAFTKADLARAMSVAKEHGMTVEVQADGTIRLVPVPPVAGGGPVSNYTGEIKLW